MTVNNERPADEKIEKFAMLMSHFRIRKENMQIFEIGTNYVHVKMTDEEGDKYEFTFTSAKSG